MRGGGGVAHGEQVMVKCFSRSEDLAKLESQEGTHSHLAATSYIISSDSEIGAQNQSAKTSSSSIRPLSQEFRLSLLFNARVVRRFASGIYGGTTRSFAVRTRGIMEIENQEPLIGRWFTLTSILPPFPSTHSSLINLAAAESHFDFVPLDTKATSTRVGSVSKLCLNPSSEPPCSSPS